MRYTWRFNSLVGGTRIDKVKKIEHRQNVSQLLQGLRRRWVKKENAKVKRSDLSITANLWKLTYNKGREKRKILGLCSPSHCPLAFTPGLPSQRWTMSLCQAPTINPYVFSLFPYIHGHTSDLPRADCHLWEREAWCRCDPGQMSSNSNFRINVLTFNGTKH